MTNRKSGIDAREANRNLKEANRLKTAQKIVDKHIGFNKLIASNEPQVLFNTMWSKFDHELSRDKSFKDVAKYTSAYNHSIKYCQELLENKDINIGFPKLIISSRRPISFRSQQWFKDGQQVLDFYLNWIKKLENREPADITEVDVLLTLIFHSAVLKAPILNSIMNEINSKKLVIYNICGMPAITLIVADNSYHTNTYVESKPVHQSMVFISPISARIINLYLDHNNGNNSKKLTEINIHNLYQSLKTESNNKLSTFNLNLGLNRFLIGAVYVLENHIFLNLPEHTWYIVTDQETSYSLPTSNWQALIHNSALHSDIHQESLNTQINKTDITQHYKSNSQLVVQISKLFRTDQASKISKNKFTAQLKELNLSLIKKNAPLNERVIVSWLLSKTLNCKVSSIQTYSNTITNKWLAMTNDAQLEGFQEDDFVTLYHEIIEISKSKHQTAKLLNQIHRFMTIDYGIKAIAELQTDDRAHHKAGYISEHMFQAILNRIDTLVMTVDDKNALSLALILGHRCGLRIGEIVKIRINDVANTQNYLEIRNNKFGNNKSLSGLRRVLLDKLLTEPDMKLLKRIYIKGSNQNSQTLICNQAGMAYNKQALSKILTKLIKEVTGLRYLTTHHLRHSCLSNFQLMSFLYDDDYDFDENASILFLKSLLPYDDAKAKSIIDYYETKLGYKKIYALAGLAGHANPGTTFTSYIHFCDIQLGLLLFQTSLNLNSKHAQVLKISRRHKANIEDNPLAINDHLMSKLKLLELDKPKFAKGFIDNKRNKNKSSRGYAFEEVRQILDTYTHNNHNEEFMHIYDVSINTFNQWLQNAERLRQDSAFKTVRGNSRLFAINDEKNLCPPINRYDRDRETMERMTNKFRDIYQNKRRKKNKALLYEFVLHTLMNSQRGRNTVNFNDPTTLSNYINVLTQLVLKKDIRLNVFNLDKADKKAIKAWNKILKTFPSAQISDDYDEIESDSYKRRIRIELLLASRTEPERLKNRAESDRPIYQWTVRTLQIFCHFVYIMIGERIIIEKA